MAQINSKQNIQSALAAFKTGNLRQNAIALFPEFHVGDFILIKEADRRRDILDRHHQLMAHVFQFSNEVFIEMDMPGMADVN